MLEKVVVQVKRQAGQNHRTYWQEFEVPFSHGMNVITLLQEIQKNPITRSGERTSPPSWDASCLEEVCGSCTMVVNGRVRQACSALVSELDQPVRLEPMSKFPLVRDLCVDRSRMFRALKKIRGWIPIDGTYDLGPGPRMNESERAKSYVFSTCMTCGCCLEVCPQVTLRNDFIGASAIGQVRLFNSHPTGKMNKGERLEALMDKGGLAECGNAQNCAKACPKEIPLTEAIGEMGRQTTVYALKKMFWR